MTPTHAAALESARDSLGVFKEIIAALPDEAMTYVPVPEGNSIAVLVAHSLTATHFLFSCGSGLKRSFTSYRSGERAPSFEVEWATVAIVTKAIDDALAEFATILANGTEENLAEDITWPGEEGWLLRTGALSVVHAAAHLREHAGHAELTRDLFRLANPA